MKSFNKPFGTAGGKTTHGRPGLLRNGKTSVPNGTSGSRPGVARKPSRCASCGGGR